VSQVEIPHCDKARDTAYNNHAMVRSVAEAISMEKLVLDTAVSLRLSQALGRVELCDATGHTIGYFEPSYKPTPEMIAWFEAQ